MKNKNYHRSNNVIYNSFNTNREKNVCLSIKTQKRIQRIKLSKINDILYNCFSFEKLSNDQYLFQNRKDLAAT